MPNSIEFVDSIASSPTVRLNLGDGTTWNVVRDGTDFSPPPLRRVVTANMLEDGARIPSAVYDLRQITLDLLLAGSTADAAATALQTLYRELDRPGGNILRYWLSTTNPVFFKTYRASATSVTPRMTGTDGKKWRVTVELLAEPFGYGLQETPVSLQTLNTNPAGGGNDCFFDVTGVKGDVETPAYIRWPDIGEADTLFAVRRRGTPSGAPFLFQAEAMTQGTNTTTQVNDVNFSGAGNNYSRCTFGTATMQTRLSVLDVGTESVNLRGRYRVFLRYRKNTSGDVVNLVLRWGDTSGFLIIDNDAYATPGSTLIQMADLGEISIPGGTDPVLGPDGVEMSVSDAFDIEVRAERTSGSGTIDFDFILLVPSDDRLAIAGFDTTDADHWMLYAGDNSIYGQDSSNRVEATAQVPLTGGLPMLTPNQTNRVYILRTVQPSQSYTLTTVTNISISYWPRYLSVRPATT